MLRFFSNNGLIIGGLFMLIFGFIIINNGYNKRQITEENRIVIVKVLEPVICEDMGRRDKFLKVEYNGRVFVINVTYDLCQSNLGGEDLKMLTNKEKDKLIFLNEYEMRNDFLYGSLLFLMAIIIIFKGWKERQKRLATTYKNNA